MLSIVHQSTGSSMDVHDWNALLGKGINIGNTLEAPHEGAWQGRLEEKYFDLISEAGFNSIRIPVRWSAHAGDRPPYLLDPDFLARVDWAVKQAVDRKLVVIVNMHHYHEFMDAPEQHKERFLAIWKQLAEHYRDYPPALYFEIMNEPTQNATAELWNEIQNEAVSVVRKSNPDRALLVAPIGWNRIDKLELLDLPERDRNLIASVHYYEPHGFTHQGAEWVKAPRPPGVEWRGTSEERQEIDEDFEKAARWSRKHNIPINVGEFGAYSKADMESRVRWTAYIRKSAEKHGMSWHYWEFYSGFGVYDPEENKWRQELLTALLPEQQK